MPTTPSQRPRRDITQAYLMSVFSYDPAEEHLRWKVNRGRFARVGAIAGGHHRQGYTTISLHGHGYLAHRIIWFLVNGTWPPAQIDHINLDKADNRWSNLRLALPHQNCANRTVRGDSSSGVKGVRRKGRKWRATITVRGVRKSLGYFPSKEEAAQAYMVASRLKNGAFSRP